MIKPTFSVIIPVLNEEQFIGKILTTLDKQTFRNFEVIIVENGSKDKTLEVIKKTRNKVKFPINLVKCKQRGISYARNYGEKYARGKYLVFFDADGKPSKHWLEIAKAEFRKRKDKKALSGLYYYKHPTKWYKTWYYNLDILIVYCSIFLSQLLFKTKVLPGNNLVIEKDLFNEIGQFPHVVCEDVDLFNRVCKNKEYRKKLGFNMKLRTVYSPRRFEKNGFWTTIVQWAIDYLKKKDSKKYDIYR